MKDADLIAAARKYLGARFRHMGRGPRFDCAGLMVQILHDCGKPGIYDAVAEGLRYGKEPHRDGLREAVRRNLGQPTREPLRPGHFVLTRLNTREPHHLGLVADYYAGGLSLIHAYAPANGVVEHVLTDDWRAKILEVYAWVR